MRTSIIICLISFLLPLKNYSACIADINISKWDCMLSVSGSVYCSYSDYDVLRATSPTGPFVKIGKHDIKRFYFVQDDGYYKLKINCQGICHETNVLYFDSSCQPDCSLDLDTPFPEASTVKHCFGSGGDIHFDASKWVTGCSTASYHWTTPSGSLNGSVLHGSYGYGLYKLKVICHDANCHYEETEFWFKIEEYCHTTSYCHFTAKAPVSTKKHCYDTDGDLWLNGASWVTGCSSATYKWETPIGIVHGPILEGNYGYGTFKLKVVCHTTECYYEEEITSFELLSECAKHCYLDMDSPLSDKIKHCYSSEGNIWIDAKSWISGCNKIHYTWETPQGKVHDSALDGQYGYGKYTLTATCHDATCYYETVSVSFELVDDCSKPYHIYCPEDKWVECDADLYWLDYGSPYYIHHGKKVWVERPHISRHIDECKRGYVTKKWTFSDPNGHWHSCSQEIFVGEDAYGKLKIDWPEQTLELDGCNPNIEPDYLPDGYQKPTYNDSGCSKLGHSYSDQEFYYNSTCKKVVRTWSVIDWCEYNPNKDPNKGKYIFHQTIKINNDDSPIVKYNNEITVTAADCDSVAIELEDLNITAESCGDKFYVSHDSPFAYTSGKNASGYYPIGTTEIIYTVRYGCGYKKNYLQKVTVAADDLLRAYCEAKLVMPLTGIDTDNDGVNDDGEALIWAKDFDLGSSDQCGGEVFHSFSADSLVMSRKFTCAEVGRNEITIYISDGKGQHTSCVVEIDIQNNAANITDCEPTHDVQDTDAGDGQQDGNETTDDETVDDDETKDSEEEENTEGETDGDDQSEEDTHEEESTDDETEDAEEDDAEPALANVSGLVSSHYGLAMASIEIELHKMETTQTEATTFTIKEVVVDSFYSRSGALLYIIEQDTVYDTAVTEEHMVLQETVTTDESGSYSLDDIQMNDQIMVVPSKDQFDATHININDANRLYAHLSGSDPITDSYALLAADVDRSGAVDFDDLDFLFEFINGDRTDLAEIPMIFIDASFEFDNPLEPWEEEFTSERYIEEVSDQSYEVDFIAITLGDIIQDDSVDETLDENTDRSRKDIVVSPNPFYHETSLRVSVEETQIAELNIFSLDGSRVYSSAIRLSQGKNVITIDREAIIKSGVFIFHLKTNNQQATGRIIKLQ